MIRKVILCIVIVLVFPAGGLKAEDSTALTELNELSDTVFQLTRQSHYEEALQIVQYFKNRLKTAEKNGTLKTMTSSQIRRVILACHEMQKSLRSTETRKKDKLKAAVQFRMLMDAIHSDHDPIWGSLKKPVMESFKALKAGIIQKEDSLTFQEKWNHFLALYDMIYPSLTIDVSQKQLKNVSNHIEVVQHGDFQNMSESSKLERLTTLQKDLEDVFNQTEEDDADPSLLWVILTTGSIILSTLTYVGFRKYRGEADRRRKRENDWPK
ncbi:sporulation protein YpjB [Bacillus sp. WMMC1349]|uniref:sporulation protein YpjB n=1 Tax=Bacillus sp. WMMC1349 TaxID=2736254 RepID=UPI001552CD4B|nr:sporulation protein YpjB [Bacillus sp. WMMC1349]NPC92815.1 sporulation protein YpjB [Bacillus sp. WMMC1349]